MNWSESVAVTSTGDHRYAAHVNDEWTSLQGVHGGVVAAIALRAVEVELAALDVASGTNLRAATYGYASGNVAGDLEVEVDVIRRGRAMVTSHATVRQNGKTTTVARFHHSTPWEGLVYSDAPPAPVKPVDAVRLAFPPPAHLNNTETYTHPNTVLFGGGARSEWLAWGRPLEGNTLDSAWLAMYGDYFPPAVTTRVTAPARAVTIEYSLQIHSAAGSWTLGDDGLLAARMHTFHSHDGFAVEDGWIYLPDGSLLATVRQTRLAG